MDEYAENEARALQARLDHLAVQRKREQAARALLAPPGPAKAVKAGFQALRDAAVERKMAGGNPGFRNGD